MSNDDTPYLENIEGERVCVVCDALSQLCECSKPAENSPDLEEWRRALEKIEKTTKHLEPIESEYKPPVRIGQAFQFDAPIVERGGMEDWMQEMFGDILKQSAATIMTTISPDIDPELLKGYW